MFDKLQERIGRNYDTLTPEEKVTFNGWLTALQTSQVTAETVKEYVVRMKESLEGEVTKTTNGTKKDMFIKARLRNYLLLEAFLTSPERAEKMIDREIANMVPVAS